MNRVEPADEIERALSKAASSSAAADGRLTRLWEAISSADFSESVYPLEHLLGVLSLLEESGNSLPEIKEALKQARPLVRSNQLC